MCLVKRITVVLFLVLLSTITAEAQTSFRVDLSNKMKMTLDEHASSSSNNVTVSVRGKVKQAYQGTVQTVLNNPIITLNRTSGDSGKDKVFESCINSIRAIIQEKSKERRIVVSLRFSNVQIGTTGSISNPSDTITVESSADVDCSLSSDL